MMIIVFNTTFNLHNSIVSFKQNKNFYFILFKTKMALLKSLFLFIEYQLLTGIIEKSVKNFHLKLSINSNWNHVQEFERMMILSFVTRPMVIVQRGSANKPTRYYNFITNKVSPQEGKAAVWTNAFYW